MAIIEADFSRPFEHLKAQVEKLIQNFLEELVNREPELLRLNSYSYLTPQKTPNEFEKLAIFCILVHAEIETFLEECARIKLRTLLLLNVDGDNAIDEYLRALIFFIEKNILFQNHGIKKDSFDKLTLLSGLELSLSTRNKLYLNDINDLVKIEEGSISFDEKRVNLDVINLRDMLHKFGSERGKFAHRSTLQILKPYKITPTELRTLIRNIIQLFKIIYNIH